MKNGAQELNRLYGKNAFRYIGGTGVEFIEYTGQHYKDLLRSSKKSEFAGEAHFYLLLQNLQGEPDQVLKRVNKFLKKYPEGTWNARGKLLFARVNDDIYNMWKESAWVIYNGELSNAEVDNKAEPYRLAAIKTLSQLKQSHKGTFAGQAAARDLRKIQTNGSDGALYSISNEASVGTWEKWGIRLRE